MSLVFFLALQVADLPRSLGSFQDGEGKHVVDPHSDEDHTGTNPANLQRTASIFDQYEHLDLDDRSVYRNVLNLRYAEPFAGGDMSFRITAPFVATDVGPSGESGFGDLALRYTWVPLNAEKFGIVLVLDAFLDTASHDLLGRGKDSLAPQITFEYYVSSQVIVATAYQHNVSVAGDDERRDINEGYLDLYGVYTSADKLRWVTLLATLILDYENHSQSGIVEAEFGMILAPVSHGDLSLFVTPGVGVGENRFFDWSIQLGLRLVGF
jgi:hypothetical protein